MVRGVEVGPGHGPKGGDELGTREITGIIGGKEFPARETTAIYKRDDDMEHPVLESSSGAINSDTGMKARLKQVGARRGHRVAIVRAAADLPDNIRTAEGLPITEGTVVSVVNLENDRVWELSTEAADK